MSVEVQVTNIVNEILKVESIEEAFSCFLVQRPELATEKLNTFLQELQVAFSGNPSEQENAVKQYLSLAVSMSNPSRLHILFTLLENLVSNNTLPARLVCDCILSCDKLVYQNECFWCESFTLIKRILPGVNYKGVREIMKSCWEKLQTLPVNLNAAVVNQTKVAESVIECIFDRHNCLLPAYFIITELQKAYPDGKKWPHWSSDYTETDVPSTSFDEKLPTDVLTSPITSEPPKKKKRTADKLINSTRQSSELPNTSDDEFQLFANSIAAQLRTLPLSKAVYLQAEIQSRISNERIKFLLSQESNVTAHQSSNICQKKSKVAKLFSTFVESFRPVAQMVSIVNHSKMLPVIEHSGFAEHLVHPWKLDPITLKLSLKGNLPYEKSLLEPQTHLLRYVLEQPYSRDMVCTMLGLQKQMKQRCVAIEEQFVELVMVAMERTEAEASTSSEDNLSTHWLWLHLSCQLIYFVLFQFANFPTVVNSLNEKLSNRDLRKGRDHLMWVLLQFISGSIQRNPLANYLPVLNLYDLLYPEKEPIPVPDCTKPECTHQMAVTCIWMQLLRKAQLDHHNIQRPIPQALKSHHEFLQVISTQNLCMAERDYRIALLCNAYSTNQEYFSRPMAALVESILGTGKGGPGGISSAPTTPLSMSVLDSLTVHSKMSLIHSIVTHVIKMAASKSNMALAPALVETYSRLLVYTEIESLGIKGFISNLLPTVFKSHAWVILYTLLEMFSYRMHHTQPHYRVQLVSHLHSLAAVPQTNQTQLHLCVESTALRLITGLGSGEVQSQLSKFLNEPKTIVSAESEELNRALVLTLARSMHITGTGTDLGSNWCKELLNTIMQSTPHSWANHTLQFFPPALSEFFQQNPLPMENKQQLKKAVDEEYRNWASMNNENDIIAHFSVQTLPLFLCLLWKMILETDRISPIAYKILERIGARALSAHLRKFCDYLVFEIASSEESHHVNKCVDAINNMIWKYNIVTIDRLVLCMALRTLEGNEAQVCFFIIQLLLIKAAELRNRVSEFVKENSPQHWKQSNWHEKHLAFHRKYPEKCAPEEQGGGSYSNYHSLPVYFGNVCLRFLPVFDIVIHRCLELPPVTKSLENLLEHLGSLYKFHDRPVTYLYNTLHYYERKLRDRPPLKRKLVSAILGNLGDNMRGFSLSDAYTKYMQAESDKWVPELDYYINLIQRIVESMSGTAQFPPTDWRFNEFPNPAAHALYITCVELMALPVQPNVVGNNLLDVISKGYSVIRFNEIEMWINSVGLVAAALPESYRSVLNDRLVDLVTELGETGLPPRSDPFSILNFQHVHNSLLENKYAYTLATAHAVWHHAGSGQISTVPQFVKDKLSPLVRTEEQLVLLCHLFGPFLQRFSVDRSKCVMDLTLELYTVLEQVDKAVTELKYMDPICDLLYHIKYMFVGDTMKSEAEPIIRRLRPALQKRLRFIAHLSIEEIENRDGSVPVLAQATVQPTNVAQSPQVS